MINLQITIDLATIDINQLDAKLSAILAAAQELAEIGALSVSTPPRGKNLPADPPTPNGAPATSASKPAKAKRGRPKKQVANDVPATSASKPAKAKRGRPKKQVANDVPAPIYGMTWPEFDALVRSEMARLGVDGRMPTTANWNNSRDVRLPTMAQILEAYDVLNLLTLAAKLELKPPHTALVREPFVVANGEVTQ